MSVLRHMVAATGVQLRYMIVIILRSRELSDSHVERESFPWTTWMHVLDIILVLLFPAVILVYTIRSTGSENAL